MTTQHLDSTSGLKQPRRSPLSARIQCALRATGYTELRQIAFVAHEGHVVLKGRVSTYYLKQIAQCVAMSTDGVEQLKNDLVVSAATGAAPE